MEVCNRRATHEVICFEARWCCGEHLKLSARRPIATHSERTGRISNEHAMAEGHVNDGIGSLGRALQAAAEATHALTCGVPDRESDEIKYLREATEQHQILSEQPMSGPPPNSLK